MRVFSKTISLYLAVILAASVVLSSSPVAAQSASNDGQYVDLIRSYECRRDRKQYGSFSNYGYWKGGRWCGYTMPAGYYVYKDGVWYIWAALNTAGGGQHDASDQSDAAAQTAEQQ